MHKRYALILLSTTMLAACQAQILPTDEDSSSSATSSAAASATDPAEAVWTEIHLWASTTLWSDVEAGTNDNVINIDEDHMIPAGAIQATFVTAPVTQDEYNEIFMDADSRDALDAKLTKEGWVRHVALDADGATGTSWGYKMDSAEGVRFLVISANASGEEYEAKVSITHALPADADL